ncbi:NAD(P)-dependent oxidoreductase [Chitinophaga pinensis]|uniref:FAD-dependent pyridine nucleotide-disulphide oxidoreductase n=1 Tax=Chitinophaga pinensis (strain ATCC 43595 / DSM 2588 / LMG 13176 / NBRC 15968 / NCIMB 11800 / UQM 2034) TaxID=485918 RepID=A0A979G4W3_CHIPD|nr:NAD(P)-dependent oxidoreductase [Chitinophaga pinensis]ACU60914.1 FAD-dependent pyridine nucleotide-disulphide oxidoreductase [Chitinophaga pinensis DSM 2588]
MAVRNNRLTAEEYEQHFSDIHPPFETRDAAMVDANRCLFCYDAPCTKSCPTGINVPKFIKQITTDNLRGAAYTILSSNIMGGGCAKVCPVEKLCEGACVYNLREEEAIPIARLQRYATEKAIEEKWQLFERKVTIGKKVAVIGAGPAGLSCAHALSREGVDVTIFEREEKGGGLMTYGIAAYKVTPQFCCDEVDFITSLGGINIQYGKELGKDITLDELQQQYDAVYLAFGVGLARQLYIPGEQMEGVVDAISFIYDIRNNGYPTVPVGDQVAVIGMGMTAIDAATQAKRLGAKEVTLVYRRTQQEMPCTESEMNIALLDGCKIVWLAAPAEILGENGKVTQLVCHIVQLEPDANGHRQPVITAEKIVLPVDMVIKAAGQMPYEQLVHDYQLHHNNGKISVTANSISSVTGVFAGGDCVNGGKEVVDAVQAGKDGAKAILQYLLDGGQAGNSL